METKNVVISKEYINKIKRFAAIRPNETFIYIPVAYRDLPTHLQTKFILRPVSGEDALRYSDTMRGEVTVDNGKACVNVKRGEYTILVVQAGLVGWENYYDMEGTTIPFAPGSLSNLSLPLMLELGDAITSHSGLSEEEILGLR